MWIHEGRLPHVLPPSAYSAATQHERERERIFLPGWHVVATRAELAQHGDLVTRELFGTPILVRNDDGELRAFVNACAHRHARLPSRARDGAALRIACAGALVFISLAAQGPELAEHLGAETLARATRIFPPDASRPVMCATLDHPCNWKIPIENVLESYHVPFLHDNVLARHPEVFRVFGGRRDGGTLAHELGARHTAYHDSLGADSRAYRALVEWLRPASSVDYVHHHAFPNVVMGHTSIVSYLQVVEPCSATASRSTIRLFLDLDGRGGRIAERVVAPLLDRVAERLIRMVMAEDSAVYADVQRGLEASPHAGVLGSREERIHHFQSWLAGQVPVHE